MRRLSKRLSLPTAIPSTTLIPMSQRGRGPWTPWLIRFTLALAVLAVFSPLFSAEFLQWDDGSNLSENPRMLPPSFKNCAYYWSHSNLSLYIPVTYTAWSALAAVSQQPTGDPGHPALNPAPFHIANILAHALAAIVVFNILRLFARNLPAAAGAILFALHPIQVEPVAWACGLKDVLAGLFGLLAIWQYLLHARTRSPSRSWHYFAALASFILALLSKPSAIMIPAICGLLAICLANYPRRRVLADLTPWVCLSIVIAVVGARAQPTPFQLAADDFLHRPLIASDALAFYLEKLIWPVNLCLNYGRNPAAVFGPPNYPAYWTWILPLASALLVFWKRKQWPRIVIAATVSFIAIFPVLGFLRFDFQAASTVADHYFYFAMLGPAIALAAFLQVRGKSLPAVLPVACALAVLAMLSHAQTFFWMSDPVAFMRVLEIDPSSEFGHSHLWMWNMQRHDLDAAEVQANAIVVAWPADPLGYMELGETLSATAHWQQAISVYQRIIQIQPDNPIPLNNLASVYASHGDPARAIPLYQKALRIKPDYPDAKTGLAAALQAVNSEKQ